MCDGVLWNACCSTFRGAGQKPKATKLATCNPQRVTIILEGMTYIVMRAIRQ
jgi:hypothetical protein